MRAAEIKLRVEKCNRRPVLSSGSDGEPSPSPAAALSPVLLTPVPTSPCPTYFLVSSLGAWGGPPVSGLGLSWEPHCCWWCFGHVRFDLQDGCPRGCAQVPRGPQTQWGCGGSRSCAHSVPPTLLFGAVSAAAKPGAKHPPIQQQRAPRRWLKYLVSSQPSKPEKSCPVVRYFRCNVFIRYIFKRMP